MYVRLFAALLIAVPAGAKTMPSIKTAAPATAAIDGWRGAKFGMTLEQVRAAAVRDLKVLPEALLERTIPAESTTALVVALTRLDPGPTPLSISYIFGATTKRLIQVTVLWEHPNPNLRERAAFVAAGQRLVRYFAEEQPPFATNLPVGAIDDSLLALLNARDAKGHSVDVTLRGVPFERILDGKRIAGPPLTGPASLRLAYSLDPVRPDVRIAPVI